MNNSWYDKNVNEIARAEQLTGFAPFYVHWFDINGVRYSNEGEGRFVSDDGDEFSYFSQYDGEFYEYWLRDEIIPDDVMYLQALARNPESLSDFQAVFNGGLRPSDYRTVKSLDIMYEGEV